VNTAQAILRLRHKLAFTQKQLADALHVTVVTVSRYENGREPKAKTLRQLADLAEKAQASPLRDIFAAKWQLVVASRIENLPSPGAERRIPKFWLELWMHRQETIFRACLGLKRSRGDLTSDQQTMVVDGIRELAETTWKDLRTFRADTVTGLNPNEDFSRNPLYSITVPEHLEWMDCLYGPPPVRRGGALLAAR
jgi:transcriptional regulator with XRE-family HTH domain